MENVEKVNDDTELQKSEKTALVQHEKTAINSHSFFFFKFHKVVFLIFENFTHAVCLNDISSTHLAQNIKFPL